MSLTETQIDRYSRQIILPGVGGEGQQKLLDAKVLIVGVGGLGSPAALYLAAAGIGTIGLVDSDRVELNNLQRQILYDQQGIGQFKVQMAGEHLRRFNEESRVIPYPERLSNQNVLARINNYDIIVDASDNFETKYLLNDACCTAGKRLIHGAVLRWDGHLMTIVPGKSPCFRCLFAEPPAPELLPSCQQAGILGAVAGVIGTLQAVEVLKSVLGTGKLLTATLLVYNAADAFFRHVKVPRKAGCPGCSIKNF